MKKIALLSFVIFLSGIAFAQCNFPIPSDAESIPAFTQKTNSYQTYWVCIGSGITVTGNGNYVYVEDSGSVNIQGDSNFVYQRAHGSLTLSGNYNTIYYGGTTTLTDNGGFTSKTKCNQGMTFDYSNAPAGGCGIPAGISGLSNKSSISIYPNPVKTNLTIEFEYIPQDIVASVISMDGKRHSEFTLSSKQSILDLSNLTSGIYYIEIKSNDGIYVERFVVE